jgi:N-acetylneuraminic acid mutarotase
MQLCPRLDIGGKNGSTYLANNQEYDPTTNTWSNKVDMPTARDSFAAAAVNGRIYAIGGDNSEPGYLAVNEEYDPVANSWSTKAAMPTARPELAAAAVNGRIYAIGGQHLDIVQGWDVVYTLAVNEEYSPTVYFYQHRKD